MRRRPTEIRSRAPGGSTISIDVGYGASQGGKDYDSKWFTRGRGTGPYAWLIGRRFQMAAEKLGLNERRLSLDTSQFRPPQQNDDQLKLFA